MYYRQHFYSEPSSLWCFMVLVTFQKNCRAQAQQWTHTELCAITNPLIFLTSLRYRILHLIHWSIFKNKSFNVTQTDLTKMSQNLTECLNLTLCRSGATKCNTRFCYSQLSVSHTNAGKTNKSHEQVYTNIKSNKTLTIWYLMFCVPLNISQMSCYIQISGLSSRQQQPFSGWILLHYISTLSFIQNSCLSLQHPTQSSMISDQRPVSQIMLSLLLFDLKCYAVIKKIHKFFIRPTRFISPDLHFWTVLVITETKWFCVQS